MEPIYHTDLTDAEWELIADMFPPREQYPNLKTEFISFRIIVNAILYRTKTGVQYRMLPTEFPPFRRVNAWHLRWERTGLWNRVLDRLREQVRVNTPHADGTPRAAEPTVAIIDSQSVKTTEEAAAISGFDGGKSVKGRKRHLLVDMLGILLCVFITPANTHDLHGAREVLREAREKFEPLKIAYADGAYQGPIQAEVARDLNIDLRVVHKKSPHRFEVLEKRWIVERSHAWVTRDRINSKEYERTLDASKGNIRLSFVRRLLRRLA